MTDHIWVLRKDGAMIGCTVNPLSNDFTHYGMYIKMLYDDYLGLSHVMLENPTATRYTHGPYTLAREPHVAPTTEEG